MNGIASMTPFVNADGTMRMSSDVGGVNPDEKAKEVEKALLQKADPIQDKMDNRTNQQAELSNLDTMLKKTLTTVKGLAVHESNVLQKSAFDTPVANAIDTTTGKNPDQLAFLITGSPAPQKVTINNITQIASQDTKMGNTALKIRDHAISANAMTGKNTALGWAGDLILGFEGETATTTINVDAGWDLETLATAINVMGDFDAEAVLQKGTTNSYQLFIQAGDGKEGKVLTIDSSAVTGSGAGEIPTARLSSVTEAGSVGATTTTLLAPPTNTFDEATDNISGFIDGKFKSVTVTGAGPYNVSVEVETDFGTTTLTDSNFVVGAGNTLTLTHPTTGATFSVDCAGSVTGLTSAYDVTMALRQMFGIGTGNSAELISPSANFSNGLASGGISADDSTLAAGTYSIKYDQASKTAILSNGSQTWSSAVVGGGGEQVITVNGLKLALGSGFNHNQDIGEIKFDVTNNGPSKLSSHTEAAGWSGTLKVGTTDSVPVNITLDRTMSLEKIVSVVNSESERSGVLARIIGDRMEFFSKETATAMSIDISGVKGVTTGNILGVTHANPATRKDELSTKFTVNGVARTIPGNKTELIKGLTTEFSATTANPILIDIDQDANQIAESIVELVTSMNEFMDFAKKQQTDVEDLPATMSEEDKAQYGTLRNESILRSVRSELFAAFTANVPGINEAEKLSTLADIGITFNAAENKFDIDNGKLTDAIANKTMAVTKIFSFVPDIKDPNAIFVSNMKDGWMNGIVPKDPTVSQIDTLTVSVTRQSNGVLSAEFTIDGDTYTAVTKEVGSLVYFEGGETTTLNGLSIAYPLDQIAKDSTFSFDITASQGIAENLKSALERITDPTTGSLKLQSDALTGANDRAQKQIDRITEAAKKSADRIREVLIQVAKAQQEAARLMKQVEDFKEAFKAKE